MKLSEWEHATPEEMNELIHRIILKETSEPIPNYTGDIGIAWRVAEQERMLVRPDVFGGGWWAGKFKNVSLANTNMNYEHPVRDDNVAMAICKAALNWHTQMEAEGWTETPIGWVK